VDGQEAEALVEAVSEDSEAAAEEDSEAAERQENGNI
jgi:hypothetical protein